MVAKVKDEMLGMTASSSPTQELKKGPWKPEEDMLLIEYVKKHGERDWNMVRKHSGLARCGKSCRLRWNNHLRPNLRKGPFSPEEERLICELHSKMGNKWARIAAMLPGRTDNEIKNFWNTRVKRLARKGVPLYPLDIQCPRPDLLNPYLHHIDGQNNNLSSSSPPSTSSSSTLQSHFQTQISPTTPTSHSLLFPPPSSPSQQFSHYDVVLQNSMALYDAALENSRQQQRQQMFASTMMNNDNNNTTTSLFHRFKRHRSVPNLTISVPPVRHVALHPFSPLGISSPLGQSVSMANTPTTSYMQVTPMPSPHSYTSSPIGMVVSPTALQLGISQMSSSQPSFRFPVSSSPPVMNNNNNTRPTCLPRTTSFLFDHMLFDLNPTQEQSDQMQATDNNNELAFSVEDLGISMEPEMSLPPNKISDDEEGAAGPLDAFLKEEEEDMKYEEAGFCTEQAKAFLNELDMIDWNANESRLDCSSGQAEAGNMESMELQDHELSNLLGSSELIWDNHNENEDGLASHTQLINHYVDEMEMNHQLTSSVPVEASSSWDNVFSGMY